MFDLKKIIGLTLLSIVANTAQATLTLPRVDSSWSWEREVHQVSESPTVINIKGHKKKSLSQNDEGESHNQLVCAK